MHSEQTLTQVRRLPNYLRYGLSVSDVKKIGNAIKKNMGKEKEIYIPRYYLYKESQRRGKAFKIIKKERAFEDKRMARRAKIEEKLCNDHLANSLLCVRVHYLIEAFILKESTIEEEKELYNNLKL
jgi:hypothetical protein